MLAKLLSQFPWVTLICTYKAGLRIVSLMRGQVNCCCGPVLDTHMGAWAREHVGTSMRELGHGECRSECMCA